MHQTSEAHHYLLSDGGDKVEEAVHITFKKLKTYGGMWRRHSWCTKCSLGFNTETFHAILTHSYFQRLVPSSAAVGCVAVARDLVVHMCVGIVELLQELVVKVLWLVVQ